MRHLLLLLFAVGGLCCPVAMAQTSCPQKTTLFCLIPNKLGVPSTKFSSLNEAIGTAVSDLPLASPASGVIYTLDPKLNLPVPSDETLGPILTQRPETVGRYKFYFASVYQYFQFEELDGISLKQIRVITTDPTGNIGFQTNSRLDLKVHQATEYFTFGLTSRLDVSVAVPILDIREKFTSAVTTYFLASPIGVPNSQATVTNSGSASGIGDAVLAAKWNVWKPAHGGLAAGVEVRLPTGDEHNFLGTGTTGVKPYGAFAYGRRVSVHANIGYQFNGNSTLAANSTSPGVAQHIPNRLFYSEGMDWRITKWVTVAGDVLSERAFRAQLIEPSNGSLGNDTFINGSFSTSTASYNRTDGSAGFKLKPFGNLIITANVIIKMDQGGLRARFVPLGGVSYTF